MKLLSIAASVLLACLPAAGTPLSSHAHRKVNTQRQTSRRLVRSALVRGASAKHAHAGRGSTSERHALLHTASYHPAGLAEPDVQTTTPPTGTKTTTKKKKSA